MRKPRLHMAWVAAAGPAANLLMAILWVGILRLAVTMSDRAAAWTDVAKDVGTGGLVEAVLRHGDGPAEFLIGMAAAGVMVNLIFMLLNLIPIPPLDGGRILTSLLPSRAAWRFAKIEPWGLPILLVLLFTNVLSGVLGPLVFESEALLRAVVLL